MKLRSGKVYSEPDVEMEDLTKTKPSDENKVYTFKSPRPQSFSLPLPIIKYITMNPTSFKVWRKLITTCKYFYSKNPVIPIRDFEKSKYDENEWSVSWTPGKYKLIDLRKISFKLWFHGHMDYSHSSTCVLLDSKVYRYDLKRLFISDLTISYEQFQKLTSASECLGWFNLHRVSIINSDGSPVAFDKLLQNLSTAEKITFHSKDLYFEPDTVKKMVEMLSHFRKLKLFSLSKIPQPFDMETFANFVKGNRNIGFHISFRGKMSPDLVEIINREDLHKFMYITL